MVNDCLARECRVIETQCFAVAGLEVDFLAAISELKIGFRYAPVHPGPRSVAAAAAVDPDAFVHGGS